MDFVRSAEKSVVPIESKYSKDVRIKDIKGLIKFMEKFKVKEGFVITENQEQNMKIEGKTVRLIPLWKWLLLG